MHCASVIVSYTVDPLLSDPRLSVPSNIRNDIQHFKYLIVEHVIHSLHGLLECEFE